MILYRLKCPAEHEFEGWFPNSAAYDRQAAGGEITCPICGDHEIGKAPMAPRIGKSVAEPAPAETPTKAVSAPSAPQNPAEMLQLLRTLRRTVEANCENVGEKFAEEARKIHYGETENRGIYGDTTPEEAEELADEGIEFGRIPWVPATDS